jgi:hypothetical protein
LSEAAKARKLDGTMKPHAVFLTLALLSVAGCANTQWYKPGSTDRDFASDSDSCQQDARRNGYFGILAGPVNMWDFQEQCLASHGWTVRTE